MPKINQTLVTGNLVIDPELRTLEGGRAVVNVRFLHNRSRKNDDGEWEDLEPVPYDLVIWGKSAEAFVSRCQKGSLLFVDGELEPNSYEKDDKRVFGYRLKVNSWQILQGEKVTK